MTAQDSFLVSADLVKSIAEGDLTIEEAARNALSRHAQQRPHLRLIRGGLDQRGHQEAAAGDAI